MERTKTQREVIEDLKIELARLEGEEKRLEDELDIIRSQKKQILDQLSENSDEKYEEDMLARVYQQRRGR